MQSRVQVQLVLYIWLGRKVVNFGNSVMGTGFFYPRANDEDIAK